ncbi:MAG TPA: AMP-binding protein, partial [Trueperaceae bacterium]|nr:AMP-binding protein [Trueperaceae bacterium]
MTSSAEPARSLPELLRRRAADTTLAHRFKRFGLWEKITWAQYAANVNALAAELVARGVQPGERVAVLCENRPEWMVADL